MSEGGWQEAGRHPSPDDHGLCSPFSIHRVFEPLSREMVPPCADCFTDQGEEISQVDLDFELIERDHPDGPGLTRQDLHVSTEGPYSNTD